MKVIALPEVRLYLQELVYILYEKGYFGFEEAAFNYVEDLFDDIKTGLPYRLHKSAPPYFNRYGMNMQYAIFRKNKNTQWYVFFTSHWDATRERIYLIRYIANNHTAAQHL